MWPVVSQLKKFCCLLVSFLLRKIDKSKCRNSSTREKKHYVHIYNYKHYIHRPYSRTKWGNYANKFSARI